jgi:hypothetical protein
MAFWSCWTIYTVSLSLAYFRLLKSIGSSYTSKKTS